MKLAIPLLAAATLASAHFERRALGNNQQHKDYLQRRDRVLYGRQVSAGTGSSSGAAVASSRVSSAQPRPSSAPAQQSQPAPSRASSQQPVQSGFQSSPLGSATVTSSAAITPTAPSIPGSYMPPLDQITMNAPIATPLTMFTTFRPGASAPYTSAPALPTFILGSYPALDVVPPVDSPQVQTWLAEIDLSGVPNLQTTVDGSCSSDPALAADQSRCWWTCGGCTRPTDITICPTKQDWGVTYDDGPSPYTPKLINYLHERNVTATFYVVGSRVISRPEMLQAEYMLGHEISIHTWSHHPLTTLTNEEIVAELGWTRQAIKDVIGVSPRYMRPPYGDIDDRVRAVCAAMDLIPVIWTGTGAGEFDTFDWKISGGESTGTASFAAWQAIVSRAAGMTTGFITLQHDLYQQAVDLAVGYIMPDALSHVPRFNMKSVIECQLKPRSASYAELVPGAKTATSLTGNAAAGGGGGGGGNGVGGGDDDSAAMVGSGVSVGAMALAVVGGLAAAMLW